MPKLSVTKTSAVLSMDITEPAQQAHGRVEPKTDGDETRQPAAAKERRRKQRSQAKEQRPPQHVDRRNRRNGIRLHDLLQPHRNIFLNGQPHRRELHEVVDPRQRSKDDGKRQADARQELAFAVR